MKRAFSPRTIACAAAIACAALLAARCAVGSEDDAASKASRSGAFPKKASPEGEPLPRAVQHLKLGPSRAVPVKIAEKKGCFFGDLDLILLDMVWSKLPEVLVTLEPIEGEGPVSSSRVTMKNLAPGSHTVSLKAPEVKQPTVMGLFVCRDSAKSGSCRSKTAESPGESFARFSPEAIAKLDGKAPDVQDKIYYFNHVVVEADSVATSAGLLDKSELERVRDIARAGSPEGFGPILKRLLALHSTIMSQPVSEKKGELVVTLPLSDFPNCSQEQMKPKAAS